MILHAGEVAVGGTLEEVLATRPSLITAELDVGVTPPALPGVTTTPTPDGSGRIGLRVECPDLQDSVHQLTGWAAANGVRLHLLRATSASLEDVFHAVRREDI